jgi:hypothetical protein
MARIEEMFSILYTLVNSTTESTIAINKCTLSTVITCLQVTHAKIDMFKLQNKMLSDELSLLRQQQCDFNKQNDMKDESDFNEDIQLTSDDTHKHEDELDEVPMYKKKLWINVAKKLELFDHGKNYALNEIDMD